MRAKWQMRQNVMNESVQFDENIVCDVCGRFGAFDFGGEHLCADCYEARASCCLEFGGDDLWEIPDRPAEGANQEAQRGE